jgi:hypothetical protein
MRRVLSSAILIVLVLAGKLATAQVNVTINVDKQPVWGPTGYDHVDYYYLPEADVYYCVPKQQYVYFDKNKWVFAATLPPRYRKVDLYKTYKVVVNEDRPYLHHDDHRKQYAGFRERHDQPVIRDSREPKYFVNKNHPQHAQWEKEQRGKKGPR